jgi:hypothetical protein
MAHRESDDLPEVLSPDDRAVYERVAQTGDVDGLHTLIARYGTAILRRGVPYVLIAARNRDRDSIRRQRARREVPLLPESDGSTTSLWDPGETISHREDLRAVLDAMATLDPKDAFLIWAAARGDSDSNVSDQWSALGFEPSAPSGAYMRKRRERARAQLKAVVAQYGER